MSVHYIFKANPKDHSTVTFDGIHISVSDLKKEILEQKHLKNAEFDLQIQNFQTKEIYQDETTLIPKNTSLIIARIPVTEKKRSSGGPQGQGFGRERFANQQRNHLANLPPAAIAKGVDLASMDATEDEKIKAMMSQSTADYDPSRYMKIRGQSQHGKVPDGYTCYKCHQTGHWIKNCPLGHEDVKKSTGIPRSFMVVVGGAEVPGALITPDGQYAVPFIDHEAYSGKGEQRQPEPIPKPKIPEELICPICQDLLTDALLVPCCATSYCDDCIRGALLESDDQECPGCHEKETSPNELIPNRFLRTAVNAFKNETGYSKPMKLPEKSEKDSPHKVAQVAAAAERKSVSIDELPEDLFPHSPIKVQEDKDNEDSTKDLYDFNDGSIPSTFVRQANENNKRDNFEPSHGPPLLGHGPPGRDFSRPPPAYHGHGPPPHYGHPPPDMRGPSHGNMEPPPPGFGEVPPPGEERSMRGQHPHDRRPDDRHNHGPPHGHGPPPGHPGGPGPFMQPPPGYGPPGNMQRPPHMGGPPGPYPPGPLPYPPQFNRLGPPGDMYGRGPGPYRDDYRGPSSSRRPFHRDGRPGGGRMNPNDETRPGTIEDPLKEFERIMREKDRRKEMGIKKRSRSRSPLPKHSPSRRPPTRSPSPFRKRSSMSPSYTRSPSPKRLRVIPFKRRNSRSRTPPLLAPRRPPRSRSRSPRERERLERERERNRSASPHRRRSPRRAPPYSPSPPTAARFVKKEKDEYFDHHSSSRYDDRERAERDRDRDRDRVGDRPRHPPSSKHHHDLKFEDNYRERYVSPGRHRFDYKSSSSRPHHTSSHRDSPVVPLISHGHGSSSRDNKPIEPPPRRIYEYEPTVAPGTDPAVPSLLDIKIHPPTTADGSAAEKAAAVPSSDTKPEEKKPAASTEMVGQLAEEKREHKRRKSSEEKKLKKEKKKHKKEEKKEKKKDKSKRKKSKESDAPLPQETVPLELPLVVPLNTDTDTTSIEKALEIKLVTVPCDSTVKSPLKEVDHDLSNADEQKGKEDVCQGMSDLKQTEDNVVDNMKETEDSKLVPIPASKWDLDDDTLTPVNMDKTEENKEIETKVPPGVLRRAENVIFDKVTPVTVQTITVSVNQADKNGNKKISLSDIGSLPEAETKSPAADVETKSSTAAVSSAVFRKPLRDRLGNKVSEDEAVRSKTDRKDSTRDKDREREREREKDKRSARRSRSRSPIPSKRPRERSRSPVRRRDREALPDLRSVGAEKDRERLPPRDRDRLPDRDRYERERRRSPRREERDFRDERDRGRPRSRSRDREDRYRRPLQGARSPQPLFPPRRPKSPEPPRRNYDRPSDRHESAEDRDRRRRSDNREPTPPGERSRSEKDLKPKSYDKSQEGGVAAAFTPFPELGAKKGKQRINIKLSSTAKVEKDSSSSSDEHDEDAKPSSVSILAPADNTATTPLVPTTEAKADDESSKKKKKTKKRKSDSSSSSSSSSSDEKQKKKSKKKKKKSKKSKKKK